MLDLPPMIPPIRPQAPRELSDGESKQLRQTRALRYALGWVITYGILNAISATRFIPKLWATPVVAFFLLAAAGSPGLIRRVARIRGLVFPLAATAVYLAFATAASHGPTIADYLYRFARALPFVLMGIVTAWATDGSRRVLVWTTAASGLNSVISTIVGLNITRETGQIAGRLDRTQYEDMSVWAPGGWASSAALVYISILTIAAYYLTSRGSRDRKLLSASLLANSIAVYTSGFATPVALLTATFGLALVVLVPRRRLLISVGGVALLILATSRFGGEWDFPGADLVRHKIANAAETVVAGKDLAENDPTDRYSLALLSYDSFLSHPIFGLGAHYMGEQTLLLGGHSTAIDWPAQFGVVGSIGPFFLAVFVIQSLRKLVRSQGLCSLGGTLALFWAVYALNCFLNPTWLEPAIDFYSFLALGLTAGLAATVPSIGRRQPGFLGGRRN